MNRIGLIGFGRFGQLLHRHLHSRVDIQVHDPLRGSEPHSEPVSFVSLPEVCHNPLLILATPVSAFNRLCQEISPHLSAGSLVMDVCAVKQYPLQLMEKYFPASVDILGAHPLFGPDSAQDSLRGHIMILTPHRIAEERLQKIQSFWETLGIRIFQMTPQEQDHLMAWTLALTHFLGRGLQSLPLPETTVATRDYQNLIQLMVKINRDTVELFQDMHRYNPYTREMREKLVDSLLTLKKQLDQLTPEDKNLPR